MTITSSPQKILAIDTSTNVQSVGCVANGVVVSELSITVDRQHADVLLRNIEKVLTQSNWTLDDVNLIAVNLGPASFTGVRVGLATAKGLSFAKRIPIVGVGLVQVLAHAAMPTSNLIIPLLDVKRGDVYGAVFRAEKNSLHEIVEAFHKQATEIISWLNERFPNESLVFLGEGAQLVSDLAAGNRKLLPCEFNVPRIHCLALEAAGRFEANGADPATLEPIYVRPAV